MKSYKGVEMRRRDLCHLIGKRAGRLNRYQRAHAWHVLAAHLAALGDPASGKMPKFADLAYAIRQATIAAASWDSPHARKPEVYPTEIRGRWIECNIPRSNTQKRDNP